MMKKCDVFTPKSISKQMAKYLHNDGDLLEPSVGTGNLLQFIDNEKYSHIDVFDIELTYLKQIKDENNLTKYNEDFLKHDFVDKKYKNIILNPPYIKIQELDEKYRKFLREKFSIFKGNFDIYLAFLYKCIQLLSEDGVMVSITPNSYLRNKCSEKFMEYLIKNKLLKEVIDFGSKKVFDDIDVYCCISVITKRNDYVLYNNSKIYYDKISKSLFEKETINLKNIVKIRNGIATLLDKIFIHDEKLFDEPCWKPIFKVSKNKIRYIIYPYQNGEILEEHEFSSKNPLTYRYLLENKDKLKERDKGKKKYANWFAFGRGQGINVSKNNEVLYISTICNINFEIYRRTPILFYAGIEIEVISKQHKIDDIIKLIDKNREYIKSISVCRGDNWFNISASKIQRSLYY
jgi:hypothetical protein